MNQGMHTDVWRRDAGTDADQKRLMMMMIQEEGEERGRREKKDQKFVPLQSFTRTTGGACDSSSCLCILSPRRCLFHLEAESEYGRRSKGRRMR